jgi:hypothetical protein
MKVALARLCLAAILLAPGCASNGASHPTSPAASDWREIATAEDRERLSGWRDAWVEALAKAKASGHGGEIAAEGALLDPDAAIDWQDLPTGPLRCRTIKVGAKSEGLLDYVAYPAFACRLLREDNVTRLVKISGSQRPSGIVLPYAGNRKVFIGTLQLGDETRPLDYGRDRERDLVALVERIGEQRWRLVFPYPHFESLVDVIELVPEAQPS